MNDLLTVYERFHELAAIAMADKVRRGRVDPAFAAKVEDLACEVASTAGINIEYRVQALTVAAVMSEFAA